MTVVFTDDQVTLSGAVPNRAAAEQVRNLADGWELTAAPIVDNLIIDPDVAPGGGIRVVEYNSVHFAGDDAAITPEHAQQLDRFLALLDTNPEVRIHVIGNTDLTGDETRNFVISQRRAEAVVDYLSAQGVDPGRLTTQPAGETNPISTASGPAIDALNRRTDYVIFGLLDA